MASVFPFGTDQDGGVIGANPLMVPGEEHLTSLKSIAGMPPWNIPYQSKPSTETAQEPPMELFAVVKGTVVKPTGNCVRGAWGMETPVPQAPSVDAAQAQMISRNFLIAVLK
jgi:hypothetical protein